MRKKAEGVSGQMAGMSLRESFEQRGIAIGELRGTIKMLLKFGKTDDEVVQYLMEDDNPLTKEQAVNALRSYREGNTLEG